MSTQTRLLAAGLSAIVVLSMIGIGSVMAAPMLNISGSGGSTTAGSTVDVTLTLENTGNESSDGPAVELTDLPDGWSIDSVNGDGGTASEDNSQVLFLSVSAGSSVSPTWTVNVPDNASAGEYTLTGNAVVSGSTQDTVNVTVTVERSLKLSVEGDKTTVQKATDPNKPPRLSVSVTNNADSAVDAPSIQITDYPDGWNITNPSGDGTWGQSDEAFVYLSVGADSSQTSSFKFDTPDDVSNGTYTVTAELIRNGSTVDTKTADVTLTGTLEEAYDEDGDDTVDEISEIQKAISDWSFDDLSIQEIQTLIQQWASA